MLLVALLALIACGGGGGGDSPPQTGSPVIIRQPLSQTVMAGQTATFTVTASGTAPLRYQWKKTGVDVSGATTASYTTPVTTVLDNDARFTVVVTNAVNSATSNQATLTVNSGNLTNSVTQYGITWTFSEARKVGQFINGDWWVQGPVTINSITPSPLSGRNGSMVNPVPCAGQGYDNRGGGYNAALAVQLPMQLQTNQSLVSSVSQNSAYDCNDYGTMGWFNYQGNCARGVMQTQAVLTCVATAPAAVTFRPPYAGSAYKPYFPADGICWGLLPRLPKPASTPVASDVIRSIQRPFIDHNCGWVTQYTHAADNFCGYGACIAGTISQAAAYITTDAAQVESVAIHLIQRGIDNYGVVKAGGGWPADGGHASGRKFPVVFAGVMLNDATLKNVGVDYGDIAFGEDCQTYYDSTPFPRWGIRHCQDPNRADYNDESSGYRTCCTSGSWPGQTLATLMLTGAKASWNHDVYFDYVDRWISEGGGYGDSWQVGPFIETMWKTYHNSLPVAGSCGSAN